MGKWAQRGHYEAARGGTDSGGRSRGKWWARGTEGVEGCWLVVEDARNQAQQAGVVGVGMKDAGGLEKEAELVAEARRGPARGSRRLVGANGAGGC